MNNLTVLAALLDEAYCNIASLMDEKAQLKQQLEQQNIKLTALQKSHLQLQVQNNRYSVHSEYLQDQVLRLENELLQTIKP